MFARAAALGLAFMAVGLVRPGAAQAHATLAGSEPASGQHLAVAPASVRLWFDEAISRGFSSARVLDHRGNAVSGARSTADGERGLRVTLPRLVDGTYGVLWHVLAEDDGHTTSGAVIFTVGRASGSSSISVTGSDSASMLDTLRRWLDVAALAGMVGAVAVGLVVFSYAAGRAAGSAATAARRRALLLASAFATGGAAVAILDLAAEARKVSGSRTWLLATSQLIVSTRWGHIWLMQMIVLLSLAVAVRRLATATGHHARSLTGAVCVLTLARVAVEAGASHAASLGRPRALALGADAVHVLVGSVWLGAVPALLIAAHATGGRWIDRGLLVSCRGRITALLAGSVVVAVVTGLYSAGREIATLNGLWSTAYGRTLLVKVVALVVLGTLGAANALLLRQDGRRLLFVGRPRPGRAGSWLVAEALVAAVTAVAIAVLLNSAPARARPSDEPSVQSRTGSSGDLVATVAVTPGVPGPNGFSVRVASSLRPQPGPIDGVALRITGDGGARTLNLRPEAPGEFFGSGPFPAGAVRIAVVVRRGDDHISVPISSASGPDNGVRPPQRLAPIVDLLALSVLALALVAVGLAVRIRTRARRGRRTEPPRRDPVAVP